MTPEHIQILVLPHSIPIIPIIYLIVSPQLLVIMVLSQLTPNKHIYKFRQITGFLHHFAIFFPMFYGDTSILCQPGRRWGGEACPICSLGECGDVNCPSYRPKRHEVRQAVEETVLQHAVWLGQPWDGDGYLVGGLEHGFYFPLYIAMDIYIYMINIYIYMINIYIYMWGNQSFPLTFIFFRGVGIPPTRYGYGWVNTA